MVLLLRIKCVGILDIEIFNKILSEIYIKIGL